MELERVRNDIAVAGAGIGAVLLCLAFIEGIKLVVGTGDPLLAAGVGSAGVAVSYAPTVLASRISEYASLRARDSTPEVAGVVKEDCALTGEVITPSGTVRCPFTGDRSRLHIYAVSSVDSDERLVVAGLGADGPFQEIEIDLDDDRRARIPPRRQIRLDSDEAESLGVYEWDSARVAAALGDPVAAFSAVDVGMVSVERLSVDDSVHLRGTVVSRSGTLVPEVETVTTVSSTPFDRYLNTRRRQFILSLGVTAAAVAVALFAFI